MDFDPQRKGSFASGSGRLCQISSKLVQNCDRESTDRQTHTHTHRDHTSDLIICPMLCYSNGTDNNTFVERHSAVALEALAEQVS